MYVHGSNDGIVVLPIVTNSICQDKCESIKESIKVNRACAEQIHSLGTRQAFIEHVPINVEIE